MLDVTPENRSYINKILIPIQYIPHRSAMPLYRACQFKLPKIEHKDHYLTYSLGVEIILYGVHLHGSILNSRNVLNQVQTETWCALVILNTDLNTLAEALRALGDPLTMQAMP